MEVSDISFSVEDSDYGSTGGSDSSYNPDKDRKIAKKKHNANRSDDVIRASNAKKTKEAIRATNAKKTKEAIRASNAVTNAKKTKEAIRASNAKKTKEAIRASNAKKTKEAIRASNANKRKKNLPDKYDLNSPDPPTKLQCKGSGMYVSNAVAAFYACQPPPPERTKPYFESMLYRPLFVKLFTLAVEKLDADLSEDETDFISMRNIMKTASLLNQYSDMLADIDDDNIEDPDFHDFVRESAHDLEPRTLDDVVDEKIKQLSEYLDDYRATYRNKTACSVAERGIIIGNM